MSARRIVEGNYQFWDWLSKEWNLCAAVLVCPLQLERNVVGLKVADQVLRQAEVDDVLKEDFLKIRSEKQHFCWRQKWKLWKKRSYYCKRTQAFANVRELASDEQKKIKKCLIKSVYVIVYTYTYINIWTFFAFQNFHQNFSFFSKTDFTIKTFLTWMSWMVMEDSAMLVDRMIFRWPGFCSKIVLVSSNGILI